MSASGADIEALFAGPGAARTLGRAHAWAATALGAIAGWPPSLRFAVDVALASGFATAVLWGPDRVLVYGDACIPLLGDRHPTALGRPLAEVWTELARVVAPLQERVSDGETVAVADLELGDGQRLALSCAPVRNDAGTVGGMLVTMVVAGRRDGDAGDRQVFATFESITDPFFTVDHSWRFTYVNAAAAAIVGRSREELLGRSLWEEFPAAVGTDYETNAIAAVRERRAIDFEAYYPAPLDIWTAMRIYPLADGVAVYYQDVTARKRAETALAESEHAFRTLADAIPTLAWTARADGFIDWYNRRWYDYTGTTPAEMEGWGWQRVHDAEELPRVLDRWQASIASGRSFEMTFPLRGADGRFRAFLTRVEPVRDAAGAVARWFGTNTDVEALSEARAETDVARADAVALADRLRASEARIRDIFDQAPIAIAVMEGPDHVYAMASPAYRAMLGDRPLLGRPLVEAVPESRDQPYVALIDRVYASGESVFVTERATMVDRDGDGVPEEYFFDVRYSPIRDAAGTVYAVASAAVDVTVEVHARREIDAARTVAEGARAEAEAANRAKSEFLAVMSHELRTPLNAIGGHAELVELGIYGPVTDAQLGALARIQRSQRHLLGLINGVLNYARIETGHVDYIVADMPLDEAVSACEALVAPQARARSLALVYHGCDREVMARADVEKVQQILLNLLSNAIKFTEPGGTVTVACADGERVANGRPATVCVRVTDTGRGIPASQTERVFQPFVQIDARLTRTQEGTGLGLAISRDLARGMRGDLTVESVEGAGSTFTLTLPAVGDNDED